MSITFSDGVSHVSYEYLETIPAGGVIVKNPKFSSLAKVNFAALNLYGFYRKSIYASYKEKPDLAADIKARKNEFEERADSILSKGLYKDPLYHYSVAACLAAMQEWKDPAEKMHAYFAYEKLGGKKRVIGFAHFKQKMLSGKPVVYIAQAGVESRGKGIGRHLMECILAHYPAGTEFYILTRVFNSEAKNLYGKRLGFTPIEEAEVEALGYDERYCGFRHTTAPEEIEAIRVRQGLSAEVACGAGFGYTGPRLC